MVVTLEWYADRQERNACGQGTGRGLRPGWDVDEMCPRVQGRKGRKQQVADAVQSVWRERNDTQLNTRPGCHIGSLVLEGKR